MKLCRNACLLIFSGVFSACSLDDGEKQALLIFSEDFDFGQSHHEWLPGFSDYPAGPDDSTLLQLKYAYTDQIPESLVTKKSIMLSGNNQNRDLFMYLKKKIRGLKPDTDYTLTFTVELASDLNAVAPTTTGSVLLKAGASAVEPKSIKESGYYVMNIDKGDNNDSGSDMISLGDILKPATINSYSLISRSNTMANSRYTATTDADGELWLIIGTDSTLEGTTTVYYTRVNIVFSAS